MMVLALAACGKRGDPLRPGTGDVVSMPETVQPDRTGTATNGNSQSTPRVIY
jgi:predicted small lipoprotein YifL